MFYGGGGGRRRRRRRRALTAITTSLKTVINVRVIFILLDTQDD